MDIQTKLDLVHKGGILEVLTTDELRALFESNAHPRHYIGFEISGQVHLGTGLCTALKIKDFMAAGIKPTIFLADYHAYINGKMGGDLEKIQKVAKGYFMQAMKSSMSCAGMTDSQIDSVKFVMGSDLYGELGLSYWKDVMQIAEDHSVARMLRCTTIMGRSQNDKVLPTSVLLYPAMQAADIWALDVDIAHAGMDQRKVHVLAREWGEKHGKKKPIAVHGKLLTGLSGPGRMDAGAKPPAGPKGEPLVPTTGPRTDSSMDSLDAAMIANKMSKSKPDSCIFIHDSEDEIRRKIAKAHCPPKVVENNPIIEMAEAFVLRERPLEIQRPEKFGGDVTFDSPSSLQSAYGAGTLHPMDLKNAVAAELVEMLKPSRDYFAKHSNLLQSLS